MSLKLLTNIDTLLAVVQDDSKVAAHLKELKAHVTHYMTVVDAVTKLHSVDGYVQETKDNLSAAEAVLVQAKEEAKQIVDKATATATSIKDSANKLKQVAQDQQTQAEQALASAKALEQKAAIVKDELEQEKHKVSTLEAQLQSEYLLLMTKAAQLKALFTE